MILEALCMGTPVVATDVGGVREIIENGVTGVLIPPRSPEHIEAGISKLLNQPEWARALAEQGKAIVLERFTFSARVEKEHALCRKILER